MAILRTVVKCNGYIAVSRKMHTSNIAYSSHLQGVITFLMQNQRNLVVSVKPWLEREGTYASL